MIKSYQNHFAVKEKRPPSFNAMASLSVYECHKIFFSGIYNIKPSMVVPDCVLYQSVSPFADFSEKWYLNLNLVLFH